MNNWQTKTMAYVGIFVLLAGDAVRYSISWVGYAAAVIIFAGLTVAWIVKNKPWATIRQTPWPLTALLALMMVGSLWSNYGWVSFGVSIVQILETAFAIMLAAAFSWRQLMTILGNTIRFILASSILFELYAAVIVRGPVPPIFKLYEGDKPPAPDYYWSRGNLFNGDRIQGILGNSNILAYVSMIGLVIFFTELSTRSVSKTVGILSVIGALGGIFAPGDPSGHDGERQHPGLDVEKLQAHALHKAHLQLGAVGLLQAAAAPQPRGQPQQISIAQHHDAPAQRWPRHHQATEPGGAQGEQNAPAHRHRQHKAHGPPQAVVGGHGG